MKSRAVLGILVAAVVTTGCDKVNEIVNKVLKKDDAQTAAQTADSQTAAQPAVDTVALEPVALDAPAVQDPVHAATPEPATVEQPQTQPERSTANTLRTGRQRQEPVRTQRAVSQAPRDEPFFTSDTGTVDPGMTEAEVRAVWGEPVARIEDADFVYLYYRNGCEASCGMYDLVLLESGQVVDAVVRYFGHTYSGVSSSPRGSTPAYTPPQGTRPTPPDTSDADPGE